MGSSSKVLSGGLWNISSKLFIQILNLVIYIYLAKMLTPEIFGQAAFCILIGMFFESISKQGVLEVVVRGKLDRVHLNSIFIYLILSNFLLVTIIWFFLYDFLSLVGYSSVYEMALVLLVIFPMTSLSIISKSLLSKEFKYKQLSLGTNIGSVFGALLSIVLAVNGYGIESLVMMFLFVRVFEAVFSIYFAKWVPDLNIDVEFIKNIIKFNYQITGSQLLAFFNGQLDKFMVGFLLGPSALGFYTIGFKLVGVLLQLIPSAVEPVLLSAFSEKRYNLKKIRSFYLLAVNFLSMLLFPAFLGMGVLSEELILILFGEKWLDASILLLIFSIQGAIYSLALLNPVILRALGMGGWLFKLSVANLFVNVVFIFIGSQYGVVGVSVAVLLRAILMSSFNATMVQNELKLSTHLYLKYFFKPLFFSLISFLVTFAIFNAVQLSIVYVVVGKVVVFSFVYLSLILIKSPKLIVRIKKSFLE